MKAIMLQVASMRLLRKFYNKKASTNVKATNQSNFQHHGSTVHNVGQV
jgi:sulfite reductase beta subunit-like hemoprotein